MTHESEFWPRDRWSIPPLYIPHPSLLRRLLCWLSGGHVWATHYWSGMHEPGWPQHDYCEKCWKFREKGE